MAELKKKPMPTPKYMPAREPPSAELIALLRQRQGAAPLDMGQMLQPSTAAGDNYVAPPMGRGTPGDMPRNPATEIAIMRAMTGAPQIGTQFLEEGLGTEYTSPRPRTASDLASGARKSMGRVSPEALIAALRAR